MLDRAVAFLNNNEIPFNPAEDKDELHFVLDTDRWKMKGLRELATHCRETEGWFVEISNPCFEVWLGYHFKAENLQLPGCKQYKPAVDQMVPGGFNSEQHAVDLAETAIENAKTQDDTPGHYMPENGVTKVYQLVEKLIEKE